MATLTDRVIDTLLDQWSASLRAAPRGPAASYQELLLGLAWSGLLLAMALAQQAFHLSVKYPWIPLPMKQ